MSRSGGSGPVHTAVSAPVHALARRVRHGFGQIRNRCNYNLRELAWVPDSARTEITAAV
jgi:hypothetical protein